MVGDMPMGSYEASNEQAIRSAQRLVKETGCQAVKLEAGGVVVERARAIVHSGIPVMGHVGLTPQTATALGGYKAQGKSAKSAIKLLEDALALQSVGCFAIVIEAVPSAITDAIVEKLEVPTIGIGAGPATSGQVLVFHDLLGITTGHMAKFVKRYADVHETMVAAVEQYGDEVRTPPLPRARARLQRRAGRARRVPPLPHEESLASAEGLGVGAAALSGEHPRFRLPEAGAVRAEGADAAERRVEARPGERDGRRCPAASPRGRRATRRGDFEVPSSEEGGAAEGGAEADAGLGRVRAATADPHLPRGRREQGRSGRRGRGRPAPAGRR